MAQISALECDGTKVFTSLTHSVNLVKIGEHQFYPELRSEPLMQYSTHILVQ